MQNSQTKLLLEYCLNLSKPWSTTTYTTCYINQLWKEIEELRQSLNFKDNIRTLQPLLSSARWCIQIQEVSSVKLGVHNLCEKKTTNTERTTLPMQKSHSKKSDWSYAHDTSNGDSVQWRNSVLQSQTASGGQNLIFTLISLIVNRTIKTGSS